MRSFFKRAGSTSAAVTAVMEQIEDRTFFSTYLVTTTADSGTGSLRDAIKKANSHAGADVIQFKIGSGLKTIAPKSQLPFITGPVTIDGTTQSGYSGKPLIEIRGDKAGYSYGLQIGGGNSTVKGLIINRFGRDGMLVVNNGGNTIKGNWIGVDNTGKNAAANKGKGIVVSTANNVIGGTSSADRNVISGNTASGLQLYTSKATGNKVLGNYIGTDYTGTKAVGNGNSGIGINGAPKNLIGGTTSGARNVISGNKQDGIVINQSSATSNTIQGNYVGLNAAGTAAIANLWYGIETSSPKTLIGGSAKGAGNVVSGNKYSGIVLWKSSSNYSVVQGNKVGTDYTGTKDVGNAWRGIDISNGSSYNKIGGSETNDRNIISGNDQDGILVYQGSNNLIQANYIGLAANGSTALKNGSDGISLSSTYNNTMKYNRIGYNGGYAVISGNGSKSNVFSGNTLINDVLFGISAT